MACNVRFKCTAFTQKTVLFLFYETALHRKQNSLSLGYANMEQILNMFGSQGLLGL